MNSLSRMGRSVHPGRYGFLVTARYVADNDDGTRIHLTVEQQVNAGDPHDACSDGSSLIESCLEIAFPVADGWTVEPTDKYGPEVEAEGDDR